MARCGIVTLIDVIAVVARTMISTITSTVVAAMSVGTLCVGRTLVGVVNTLVNVCARTCIRDINICYINIISTLFCYEININILYLVLYRVPRSHFHKHR